MANPILLKHNSTSGVVPAAAALTVRELALNTADGRLFTKTGAGAVVEFARKDATQPSGTYKKYIDRVITGVSTDPAVTNAYYEIGQLTFSSMEGELTFEFTFNGSGLGCSSRYQIPVSYAMDFRSKYGLPAYNGEWTVITPTYQAPRHYLPNADDYELQAYANGNTIKFRLVVTTPSGGAGSSGTVYCKILHSNQFDNCTWAAQSGTGLDAAAYPVVPLILTGLTGTTLIHNPLNVVGGVSENGVALTEKYASKSQCKGTNLAVGSVITSSGTLTGPAMITDGVKAISANYWNLVPDAQWIQLNLNAEKLVPEAWFYLYNLDNRRYNIAVAVSSNLTTWEWILGSGSAAGVVASYVQSRGAINGYCPAGVEFPTIVPINSFCQYVRLYMNGSTANTGNHGYEIELWNGGAPTDPYIQAVAANLVQTTDSRLSNARVASDVSAWAKAATKPAYTATEVGLGLVNNTADSAKPVSTLQQTALNLKADSSHKYHSFASGQYFYDSYEQGNYFRLFTENARSDNIRFGAVTSPEYFDYAAANEYIAWTGAEGSIGALLDGREDTGLSVTHANRNFRFVVARNTGWPTLGMLLLQSTWTAISYPGMVVTLETSASASGPWVVRDTATFTPANTSNNWGCHVRCTGNLHNGTGFMRITVNITDWVDSGSYTTAPLRRICFFSNYDGASQLPWSWNYARTVNFFAVPTVNSTAVVLTNDARLTNARAASDVSAWAKAAAKPAYTAAEVGLGNVNNTEDAAKAVSSAVSLSAGADRTKLDGIAANANNYAHPANHPASVITQDASNRFVSDTEKAVWNRVSAAQLGQTSNPLTTMATNADWGKPSGYQTMIVATGSTGLPAGHGQPYFGYTVTSKRDTAGGYSALLTSYDGNQLWFTYNGDAANAPTWKKVWHDGNLTNLSQLTNGPGYVTSSANVASATTLAAGADRTKLDGIAVNANNYVLPAATVSVSGGVKVGTGLTISDGVIASAGAEAPVVISANTAAVAGTSYVMTATLTLTLPASPAPGSVVSFQNTSGAYCTVARNGQKIMSLDEDLSLDLSYTSAKLVYVDVTQGWLVTDMSATQVVQTSWDAVQDKPTTIAGYGITDAHPESHPASIIVQDSGNRFVTDAEKTAWNGKQPAGTYATGTGSASGTNTGDNAANTTYANDYRAANFVAGTNYLAPNGSAASLTGLTSAQVTTALGYTPSNPGGLTIVIASGSLTATAGTTYVLIASLTLTLPASPSAGALVNVSNRSGAGTCVIARNAQNLMGLAENMTLDVEASLSLVFADATRGWVLL